MHPAIAASSSLPRVVVRIGGRKGPCSHAIATANGLSRSFGNVQTRHASASSSSDSSSSTSQGDGSGAKSSNRSGGGGTMRVPLLVGGSLVGAGSLQYYLHRRALATGGSAAAAAATTTGLQRALSTSSSSSPSPLSSAFPPSRPPSSPSSPPPPPPRVQAPSLLRGFGARGASTAAAAAAAEVKGGGPLEGLEVTVYQYKICPFCCKVKAVLDLYKIPYSTLDVNPLTKSEIQFSPDYRKVPIVKLGEEVVRDSSAIVDRLAALLRQQMQGAPALAAELDSFFSPEAARWAAWADMELAVLLFPNITRSFAESFQAFSYVQEVPHFNFLDKLSNQWVGAAAMWAAQGKIKKKYGITDERAALRSALDDWAAQIAGGKQHFLGGKAPNYGDVAVYACLRAIEGLDAWKEIMADNVAVADWYRRVEGAIGASACIKAE